MKYPVNLPEELKEDWNRIEFLHALVANPMDLRKIGVKKHNPVLMIGTETHNDAVLCEFSSFVNGLDGKDYFLTEFKVVLRTPLKVKDTLEPRVEIFTPNSSNYSRLMPVLANTIATGDRNDLSHIEDTLYRIEDYEIYAKDISSLFQRLRVN